MGLIYWTKKPDEELVRTIDETDALPAGETLAAGPTITATDSEGNDVTEDLIDDETIDSPYVTLRLLARTSTGTPPVETAGAGIYMLKFLLPTTPSGMVLQEDVELTVKEVV